MTSLIYNSALTDEATGAIDYDTDAFKCMLVGPGYVPNQQTHRKRSDVTDETSGTGYTAGGVATTVSVAEDSANNRTVITLGAAIWTASTITASGAVYYKSRGGVANVDELIAFIDFAGSVSSSLGAFTLQESTIRKQN